MGSRHARTRDSTDLAHVEVPRIQGIRTFIEQVVFGQTTGYRLRLCMSSARVIFEPMNSHAPTREFVIEAGRVEKHYWSDVWHFRDLFYILSWRDLRVRYKQTVIGVGWAVVRPLLTMVIFTVVFGSLARFKDSAGAPYPIVVLAGMIPWQFISTALAESSSSLISNSNLLTKVYFPRIIIPVSSIIVSLTDAAISLVLLLIMMACFRFVPRPQLLLLPVFCLPAFCLACGAGLFATALNVKYRDFRYVIPFVVQIGTYLAPVGYTSAVIAQRYSDRVRLLYSINPAVGVIDGFRWCIIGDPLYLPGLWIRTESRSSRSGWGSAIFAERKSRSPTTSDFCHAGADHQSRGRFEDVPHLARRSRTVSDPPRRPHW